MKSNSDGLSTRSVPPPLIIDPSQNWSVNVFLLLNEPDHCTRDGDDGPWSTFFIGVGTPPQFVRTLVSATIGFPMTVWPEGCNSEDVQNFDCAHLRGELFHTNQSRTWDDQGIFAIADELDLSANVDFGFDNVTLGLPGSSSSNITLPRQIAGGIATKDYFVANWGLAPSPINLTTFDDPIPSMSTNLKQAGHIPSLSWGYTAGAYYQNQSKAREERP